MTTNLASLKKWGECEKAHWLSQQTIKRSYLEEVVEKIMHLKNGFKVHQYGTLEYEASSYPSSFPVGQLCEVLSVCDAKS